MQVARWRTVFILKNSLTPLSIRPIISSASSSCAHYASFHSTPIASDKWKDKWNHDFSRSQHQQPSKNYLKYVARHKRADARRALKNLLFNNGCTKFSFEDEGSTWNIDGTSGWDAEPDKKKGRLKSSNRHGGRKAQHKRHRRKYRKDYFSEDDYSPEMIFQAMFGNSNKWCTWSCNPWGSSFQSSTTEFEWREEPNCTNKRKRKWENASDIESDSESCVVGSYSDRVMLGLPPTGPLKMEDVKNAFRLSALKWHPDKHQGPSQAKAEEKFKLCVNAYKSLCNALSTVES